MIVEAQDFRGQPYQATFDLTGAGATLKKVLELCHVSQRGMDQRVEGLRREIALDLELWGPLTIFTSKKILASHGVYNGPQDNSLEPDFALAVQGFYDSRIAKCKDGSLTGTTCNSLRFTSKTGIKLDLPSIGAVIYDSAQGQLKKEAGSLRTGD